MSRWFVSAGDYLALNYASGVALAGDLFTEFWVRDDRGRLYPYKQSTPTFTFDRSLVTPTQDSNLRAGPVSVPGELVGIKMGGGPTFVGIQRGQVYVMAGILRGGTRLDVVARDYVFDGNFLSLGSCIPPGPGGGHGWLRNIVTADPAAGAEIAQQFAPTSGIWRIRGFQVDLVQGAIQTPLPSLAFRTFGGLKLAQIPITTTAIAAASTSHLTWGIGLVQSSFTTVLGDEIHTAPLPDFLLGLNESVETLTDGLGANTDYGAGKMLVEDWVMP